MSETKTVVKKTRIAHVHFSERGFVVVEILPNIQQTIEDAQHTIDLAVSVSNGIKQGILVNLTKAVPLTAEVRQIYKGPNVDANFSAVALLIEASAFGRSLGNFYLNATSKGAPKKLFTDMDHAAKWLMSSK